MSNKYYFRPTHGNSTAVETKCDYCEKIFWESKNSFNKKKRHFCNQKCYSDFQRERLPKKEHNSFGHGHSPEERAKRRKARTILNHAIRDGKIKRLPCLVCGEKAEAHHDNYDKPLDVKWLCFVHHRKYENPELLTLPA